MGDESEVNLYDIPLMGLRASTRQLIVNELNKTKILASGEGLPRDWRGLAHLANLPLPSGDSPAAQLLSLWGRECSASLGQLEHFLEQLDRWDIVDDISQLIRHDAKEFLMKMVQNTCTKVELRSEVDTRVLTFDDIIRLEHGMEVQMYDAFLLYADEDQDFAKQMVDRLQDYCLKLCLKENLVGGLPFEHQGIMQLISERCHRVIIILSHSFINSPVNRFLVTFAQALAIEQSRRIIIPCIYGRDRINLPMEINYLHKLDYNRVGVGDYDFWKLLRASVTSVPSRPALRAPPATICEINDSTQLQLSITQKAIKPATDVVTQTKDRNHFMKSTKNLFSVTEVSSSNLNSSLQNFTCSTLSLPEKKHKSISPTHLFRKLFRSDVTSKQAKKNKKIAVRL